MLFHFAARSSLLLPFGLTGTLATGWLLLRAVRRGTLADALLALLVLVPTLLITQQMLANAGWSASHDGYSLALLYAPWQLNLFLGPAYYLYFRSLTNQEFRLRPRAWWHLLPGLVQLALATGVLAYDLGWLGVRQGQPLLPYLDTGGPAMRAFAVCYRALAYLQYPLLPLYCGWVLVDYRRYFRYLDNNFSNSEQLRFAGLRQLLLVQLLVVGLNLGFELLAWQGELSSQASWSYFFLRGLLVYCLIGVGLQANYAAATTPLRFDTDPAPPILPAPLPPPPTELPPALVEAAVPVALAPSPAAELAPELLAWRDKLLALMREEQPWLEPELTLTELAKRLRTTPGLLSKVINTGCEQNFNDFVNTYRVREAQRLLTDPRFAHYSLVGIALESGFNSRSTFNRVFKKVVGQAPSELIRPKS